MPETLFIYGTLHPDRVPAEIAPAVSRLRELGPGTVFGRLYDLGPYPASSPTPPASTMSWAPSSNSPTTPKS